MQGRFILVGKIQILNALMNWKHLGKKCIFIYIYISFHRFPGAFLGGGVHSRCFIQTSWFLFKDLTQQELPKSTFGSSQEMVQ